MVLTVVVVVADATVVVVADEVVAVVDVDDVVGQAPSPGMQLDGPAHAFPFLFRGTITS